MQINIQLPNEVKEIIQNLNNMGHDAFAVGGCIRDSILSKVPKDWDITTQAKPQEILSVFSDYHTIPTGIQHGTVTIMINHKPFEVTTYRIDGNYDDFRHPSSVEFTDSLMQDLARRDFTINSMAYYDGLLIDPYSGYEDLQNNIIRCVGNADDRFFEDPLRMLRAIRFMGQLDFLVAENTRDSIVRNVELITRISMERIQSEFSKIILTDDGIAILSHLGLLNYILPEVDNLKGVAQNNQYHCLDVFLHTMIVINSIPENLILRLAALLHDVGKPLCKTTDENGFDHFYGHAETSSKIAFNILKRMKYDNDTIHKVITLIEHHDFTPTDSKKSVLKLMNSIGTDLFFDLMELKKADIDAHSDASQYQLPIVEKMIQIGKQIIEDKECFSLKDLAINGHDLINIGYTEGTKLGNTLDDILQLVINGFLINDREILLEFAQKVR
jgi:tRNA nucleotidyltransferase (CCA-adding enzyme)